MYPLTNHFSYNIAFRFILVGKGCLFDEVQELGQSCDPQIRMLGRHTHFSERPLAPVWKICPLQTGEGWQPRLALCHLSELGPGVLWGRVSGRSLLASVS